MKKTIKIFTNIFLSVKIFLVSLFGFIANLSVPSTCFAAKNDMTLGNIAGNLFDVEGNVHSIVKVVCLIAGTSLILGALLQYKKYRQNPIETRLSTVIFTLIVGIGLIVLAFIPMQTD